MPTLRLGFSDEYRRRRRRRFGRRPDRNRFRTHLDRPQLHPLPTLHRLHPCLARRPPVLADERHPVNIICKVDRRSVAQSGRRRREMGEGDEMRDGRRTGKYCPQRRPSSGSGKSADRPVLQVDHTREDRGMEGARYRVTKCRSWDGPGVSPVTRKAPAGRRAVADERPQQPLPRASVRRPLFSPRQLSSIASAGPSSLFVLPKCQPLPTSPALPPPSLLKQLTADDNTLAAPSQTQHRSHFLPHSSSHTQARTLHF